MQLRISNIIDVKVEIKDFIAKLISELSDECLPSVDLKDLRLYLT